MTNTFNINLNNLAVQNGTFYVAVFGCQMNVYDGDRIRDLMQASGYTEVSEPNLANIIIFVTCAVRAKAENRVFKQIETWRQQKIITENKKMLAEKDAELLRLQKELAKFKANQSSIT